ncbi:hypothetical protein F0L74_06910 [Chitinophaga agrisoli]|uniref:Uncharacterized protein n=1 Tax=Chitinophaga agrisoli TaxID=2607653 RepID=A0A5B2W636_9BACT|nr:hypothetical protein [Chitinophaga agrisoli]KAA2245679.1 hypothetical protein F0L74_06910 [Chitinophaga agrisoli]
MNTSIRSKLTLLLIILFPLASAHATQLPGNLDTTAAITAIRAAYQKINAGPNTVEIFKYTAQDCVNEGEVTYFFNAQKEVVKIVETGDIGDGVWSREFYYQSGKFIFCYELLIGGPAEGPEMKSEFRTYVKDDQVIRFMEDKKIMTPEVRSADALAVCYKLVKARTTKKFAEVLCH